MAIAVGHVTLFSFTMHFYGGVVAQEKKAEEGNKT